MSFLVPVCYAICLQDLQLGQPRAEFTYGLYRLKPRASKSKGAFNKLWYA